MATVDTLADDITAVLMDYRDDIDENMRTEITKLAKKTRDELKNDNAIPERTGDYKKSFYIKKEQEWTRIFRVCCCQQKYQLAHLLENGHLTKDGTKRTKAYPHWKPAEDRVEKGMDEIVKRIMG